MSTVAIAAYRTSSADKLAVYSKWQDDLRDHRARIREWRDRVDPERKLTLKAWRGFIPAYFEGDEAPTGWRRNKDGRVVPDKRLKAGKAAAAEMEALRKSSPDDLPKRLGLPTFVMSRDRWYEPGIFAHDGALYVHWGAAPDDIDLTVWTELKLSEFYAAKEAYDEDRVES